MITLLSPTKTQNNYTLKNNLSKSEPLEFEKAKHLISVLCKTYVRRVYGLTRVVKKIFVFDRIRIDCLRISDVFVSIC